MKDFLIKILLFVENNFIAILSLIISIINILSVILSNKKNLNFTINNYTVGNVDGKDFYMFDVDFINRSAKPISIIGIKIKDQKKVYHIIKSPRKLLDSKSTVGGIIVNTKTIDSVTFPINLQGYMSEHAFIIMYGPKEYNDEKQKIVISTSRGKTRFKKNIKYYYISAKDFMDKEKHYKK